MVVHALWFVCDLCAVAFGIGGGVVADVSVKFPPPPRVEQPESPVV